MRDVSRAVLVTGASSGIGRATAQRLSSRGWPVYATARRLESIADLQDAGCTTLRLDATNLASISHAVARVEEGEGAVGVLVNNAGFHQSGAIESVPMDKVRLQFETNVFGLIELTRRALPGMRRQGWGRIVNVSSMGGKLTLPGGGYYHATKHALEAISDALRFEVAGFGVDVVVIEPGIIWTRLAERAAAEAELHGDGAYAAFDAAIVAQLSGAYVRRGMMRFLGRSPEAVAAVIEKAVTAARPRVRYRVSAAGRLLMTARKIAPDRVWDAYLRRGWPRPGADELDEAG